MKSTSSTRKLHWVLLDLNHGGETGIPSVGVESVDIWKNTGGEGGFLADN